NKLLTSPTRRMRKAYSVSFRVIMSYAWLFFRKRLFGQTYYDRRIQSLHQRNAERVKIAVLELQGLFIKVGQLLSILSNFLPEAFQEPLDSLQDQVPPRPVAEVRERIIQELGAPPEALFADFTETPLAAASIGQTHRARLKDGSEVVVKVQHANIEAVADVDMRVIHRLQTLLSWWFEIKGIDHVYTQVKQMINEELDFFAEAQSMQAIASNFVEESQLIIPKVYTDYSTRRVLTTNWCSGVKISNVAQLEAWGVDMEDLAARLLTIYCQMVLKDGFYHADPHPGNILVQDDGTIVLLDFGAVAKLSDSTREGLADLLEAAVKNDVGNMIEASRKMGFIAPGREAERLAERMIEALRTFLQQEIKLEGLNFKEVDIDPFNNSLFDLIKNIGINGVTSSIQVPKEYVLLNRMATLLLGISNTLAPRLNPLDIVRPYMQQFVLGNNGDLVNFVSKIVRDTATDVLGLPAEINKVLRQMRQGQLDVASVDTRQSGRLIYQGIRQLTFAILLIAAAGFTYLFWQRQEVQLMRVSAIASFVFLLGFWRALREAGRIHT
ncbi:MAG: AarF/UbiB family protein, partial [Bacteroidota bacterium]